MLAVNEEDGRRLCRIGRGWAYIAEEPGTWHQRRLPQGSRRAVMQTLFGTEDGAGLKQKKAPGGELEEAAFMPAVTFCGFPEKTGSM